MKWLAVLLIMLACEGDKPSQKTYEEPVNPVRPPEPKEPEDPITEPRIDFLSVSTILQDDCAMSGCHKGAPMFENEDPFFQSDSVRRIEINSMPPRGSPRYNEWNDEKKNLILEAQKNYVQNTKYQ